VTDPRDEEMSRIYRDAQCPAPPARLDDAILAASRRAVGAGPRPVTSEWVRRMRVPVALAATIVLTLSLTLMVIEQQPVLDSMDSDSVPPSGRREPARIEDSASQPARPTAPASLPTEAKRAERATPTEKPSPAKSATTSSEATGNRASDALPADPTFVPDLPATPAPRALRQRDAMKPAAPAAPAGAAAGSLGASAQRAAPTRDEARASAAEAKERTPEAWIEDIRKLKAQGRLADAERELAEFRQRHPEYRVPEDLR